MARGFLLTNELKVEFIIYLFTSASKPLVSVFSSIVVIMIVLAIFCVNA